MFTHDLNSFPVVFFVCVFVFVWGGCLKTFYVLLGAWDHLICDFISILVQTFIFVAYEWMDIRVFVIQVCCITVLKFITGATNITARPCHDLNWQSLREIKKELCQITLMCVNDVRVSGTDMLLTSLRRDLTKKGVG